MKLSMWMIANRLRGMDINMSINKDAAVHLKSPRLLYATDCVHVYQKGKDVYAEDEKDVIVFKNADVQEMFVLLQSVFDFYEDLASQVNNALENGDIQQVIDACWLCFKNPLAVIDKNMKALALSSHYGEHDLDDEWRHLVKYGYSSVAAIAFLKQKEPTSELFAENVVRECRFNSTPVNRNCYTAAMYHESNYCGRITLIEESQQLNIGDSQLISWLITQLAPVLARNNAGSEYNSRDLIIDFIKGVPVSSDRINTYIKPFNWRANDGFSLYVFVSPSKSPTSKELTLLKYIMTERLSSCIVSSLEKQIVLIVNDKTTKREAVREVIQSFLEENNLRVGMSLPIATISNLKFAYRQALSAIEYGLQLSPEIPIYDFYDYALDFLIESQNFELTYQSCSPDIVSLWRSDAKKGTDNIAVISSYLRNERSLSATARELGVHKNTFSYRIRKLEEKLLHSLDDEYFRDYVKQSIRVLHLNDRRNLLALKESETS